MVVRDGGGGGQGTQQKTVQGGLPQAWLAGDVGPDSGIAAGRERVGITPPTAAALIAASTVTIIRLRPGILFFIWRSMALRLGGVTIAPCPSTSERAYAVASIVGRSELSVQPGSLYVGPNSELVGGGVDSGGVAELV